MSNAIGSSRESNPSRRICHLRAVPLGNVADKLLSYKLTIDKAMLQIRKANYIKLLIRYHAYYLVNFAYFLDKDELLQKKKQQQKRAKA